MSDSSPSTYSFHGPNTSHSKDTGSGSRTYHVPNYATSYANDKSKLISVKFVEDKELSRAVIVVVSVFLLFAAVPLCMTVLRSSQVAVSDSNPSRSLDLKVQPVAIWHTNEPERAGKGRQQQITHNDGKEGDSIIAKARSNIRRHGRPGELLWVNLRPGEKCLGYGVREYKANLKNLPFFAEWEASCKETEIEIHGILFPHPVRCERKWPLGRVTGHWIVDHKEDRCLARWGKIINKGCTKKGSGIRRFSSRLYDVANGEDWLTICATTPAMVDGSEQSRPAFCEDHGFWGFYGVWDLEDQAC